MGLEAVYQNPRLSRKYPEHRIYPYLLRSLDITGPNQVWCSDITYIRMNRGFIYLTVHCGLVQPEGAVLGNSDYAGFILLRQCAGRNPCHSRGPEIFNNDQGAQYMDQEFTKVLKNHCIRISMDGRGRVLDNIFVERLWRTVKYEEVYLKEYQYSVERIAEKYMDILTS